MIFKKKLILLTLFLIIFFQAFLYTNNKNKTSFRYFKWTVKEVSVGKLITISFFSGLFVSTLLNNTVSSFKKDNHDNIEEIYEPLNNEEEEINSNVDIPPQRDIRDTQPTISVNYRVIKNTEEKNLKKGENYSNNPNSDDWEINENDW